jgi:hypothetical protein
MAKYKIVGMPKFPGGGEVELDGYRYKQDTSGKWFFTSGAPVTDPIILQRLQYEAKPVGTPAPSPYAKPDIRTGNMKVTAASRVAPYRENAIVLENALAQKQAEDQRAVYEQQRAAEEKRKLDQEQAFALANPNAVLSETLGNVAAKTTPQTNEQWQNFEGAKQDYYNKRNFLADNALNENYDAIAYEVASDIQKNNPKLTFEEALAKAKEDTEALKKKAVNTYVTQDPDVLDRVARERGFYSKQKAGNTTMQQYNPNDPRYVSFADPGTVEGYLTRAKDAVLNPLDATQYFMTGKEMPYNYSEYEKMKQATGYQDAADQNAVLGAVDFASWFHPVGLYGQGMKMIEPTVESIGKVIENPTWENVGTAAWDTGMAALTFAGSKSPLKFMAEEAQATRNAEAWSEFMRKPTGPNPANSGTGLLPVASLEAAPSVLPSVPVTDITSMAALSNTVSPAKFAAAENKIAANAIDDAVDKKLLLWQTPEGINRLQQMIENTPALAGETPQSFLEGLSDLKNFNAVYQDVVADKQAIEDSLNQLEILYNEGKLNAADYKEQIEPLEKNLDAHNKAIANGEKNINEYSASYNVTKNAIGIRPGTFKPEELGKVVEHELGHFPGGYATKGFTPTYLDDELSNLDLITDTSTQLLLPLFNETSGNSAHYIFGKDNPDYLNESLRYFKEGTSGTEKVPYLSEVRQDMLEKGIIKSEYDKITPKMLKDHFKDYKNTQGEKYPLRLYDIIKDKPENFNRLSKVLDKLPMIMQAVGLADAFFGDEDVDTKEAGFSLMLGALGKGKLKNASKKLKKFTSNAKGAVLYKDKALGKQADMLAEKRIGLLKDWQQLNTKTVTRDIFNEKVADIKDKLKNQVEYGTIDPNRVANSYMNQKQIAKIERNLPNIEVTDEGLRSSSTSSLKDITTSGQSSIVSFQTGESIPAEVTMPTSEVTYVPKEKGIEIKFSDNTNPRVSSTYIQALTDNINHVEKITGAKVFGSALGVTKGGLPHLTGDIDTLILDTDYNRNVKPNLKFVANKGPAKVHEIGINKGEQGHIDFNIINTNSDGTVKVTWQSNPNTGEKRSLELELFRQFFPDQYYAEQKKAIEKLGAQINPQQSNSTNTPFINLIKGSADIDPVSLNLQIPIDAKTFMDKVDPAVKTIIDAYESSKLKHINRIDTYINYGDIDLVKKGQETYLKSLVGSKGTLGPQLSDKALSNVSENKEALLSMGFIGDIDYVAQNPKRMQLALNDYYINNSVHTRQIVAKGSMEQLNNAFKNWDITQGGGNARGYGLNTVKLGDPQHGVGNVFGQLQYDLNIDASSPMAYVDSIKFTSTGTGVFNPEQKEIVKDILKKYSGKHYNENYANQIKKTGDLLKNTIINSVAYDPTTALQVQKIFNEITEKLGVRSAAQHEVDQYGNSRYSSVLGDFDEAKDLLQYSIISLALKPKSLLERQASFKRLGNQNSSVIDADLIKSLEDYKKIENYINGGLDKAKDRIAFLKAQMDDLNDLVNEKAARYAAKQNPELKQQLDDLQKTIDGYDIETKRLYVEAEDLRSQAKQIKDFRGLILPTLLSASVIGTVGTIMYASMTNPSSSERHKDKSKAQLNDFFQTDELSKKETNYIRDYFNKNNTIKGFKWPDGSAPNWHSTVGEKLLMEKDHLKPPKKRFEEGGAVELDLTQKEIQEYIKMGYVVEQH